MVLYRIEPASYWETGAGHDGLDHAGSATTPGDSPLPYAGCGPLAGAPSNQEFQIRSRRRMPSHGCPCRTTGRHNAPHRWPNLLLVVSLFYWLQNRAPVLRGPWQEGSSADNSK